MASQLTPCPECGNMISPRATSCPKCGSPLQARPIDVSEKEQIADERFMPEKRPSYRIGAFLRKKPLVWVAVAVVIVGIVVIVSIGVRGPGRLTKNDQAKTKNKESAEEKAKHEMASLITTVDNLDSPLDGRMAAIRSIGAKGAAGKMAVPALIRVVNNSQQQDLRLAAADALGQIGPEAKESVQSLIEVMKHSKAYSSLQNTAAEALLQIAGRGAEASAPIVTEVLRWTHDLSRRTAAATALGHCRAVPEESVQLLLEVLNGNEYTPLGRAAVRALGNIGPGAKTALPKLILLPFTSRIEKVPDFYFQFDTLEALCKISSEANVKQDAVKRLTDIIEICRKRGLNDPHYHDKSYSDDLKLFYKVDFGDVSTPYNAIRALGNCGPTARTAIPVLRSILDTDDSDCRKAARDALKKIEQ